MDRTPPPQPATVVDLEARRRARRSQPIEVRIARAQADAEAMTMIDRRDVIVGHLCKVKQWVDIGQDPDAAGWELTRAVYEAAAAVRQAERIVLAGEIA